MENTDVRYSTGRTLMRTEGEITTSIILYASAPAGYVDLSSMIYVTYPVVFGVTVDPIYRLTQKVADSPEELSAIHETALAWFAASSRFDISEFHIYYNGKVVSSVYRADDGRWCSRDGKEGAL